jgi:hypothetical protein
MRASYICCIEYCAFHPRNQEESAGYWPHVRSSEFESTLPLADTPNVKELHAKIGQLAMESDFLAGAFGRIPDGSVKR